MSIDTFGAVGVFYDSDVTIVIATCTEHLVGATAIHMPAIDREDRRTGWRGIVYTPVIAA